MSEEEEGEGGPAAVHLGWRDGLLAAAAAAHHEARVAAGKAEDPEVRYRQLVDQVEAKQLAVFGQVLIPAAAWSASPGVKLIVASLGGEDQLTFDDMTGEIRVWAKGAQGVAVGNLVDLHVIIGSP